MLAKQGGLTNLALPSEVLFGPEAKLVGYVNPVLVEVGVDVDKSVRSVLD